MKRETLTGFLTIAETVFFKAPRVMNVNAEVSRRSYNTAEGRESVLYEITVFYDAPEREHGRANFTGRGYSVAEAIRDAKERYNKDVNKFFDIVNDVII